ncbi:MAG: U32 family peptidase [Oscillospiraceae bacterium]|nr:U32 family peptidase [Oscillospiraceae bacterium]
MMELLSPAGSPEAVRAAVQSGADAIYLGAGDFNARRSATNFDLDTLRETVDYCHLRGVHVYLTMNTLLYDRELSRAAQLAQAASAMGVDAVLVQDLGVARMIRQAAPDLPLHASTQMSIHDLAGAQFAADLGMTRVVVSRELPKDQIAHICAHSPVEIEVFVHGALCMCYSGQCFFSSVIGGRSGNRGMCAQPCRLQYGWNGKANQYPLSLRDSSLAEHLRELESMGVACAKIEGRMKRPEYVSIVTKVYATALREGRTPTQEELSALEQAFSRQGFTDGYFMDKTGPDMFGIHEKNPLPEALFADARRFYGKEQPLVPITVSGVVKAGEPVSLTVRDADGHTAAVSGLVPDAAQKRSLERIQLVKQWSKTGGTPYRCQSCQAEVEEGLSLPVSALNDLRREALERLSVQRVALPPRRVGSYSPAAKGKNSSLPPEFTVALLRAHQCSEALLGLHPRSVALPLEEYQYHPDTIDKILQYGVTAGVTLPRILWDRERPAAKQALEAIRDQGVTEAYASTWSGVMLAKELGFTVRGDFGLGVMNSETLRQMKCLGLASAVVSFELKSQRVRDLCKSIPTELYVYGRLPLMITENCIIKNRSGVCECNWKTGKNPLLTDRKNTRFPVVHAYGCRNEILNAVPLWLADKPEFWQRSGLEAVRLSFTTESAKECARVLRAYRDGSAEPPKDFTRGLYFREVE